MAWTRMTARLGGLGLAVLLGACLGAGCKDRGSEAQARAEQAGREAGAAARDAARTAKDAAQEAGRNIEAWLKGFREETDKLDRSRQNLEARSKELQGQARTDADRRIAELDRQQKELARDVEDLKHAAADRTDAIKAKINEDLEKLRRAYEAAERELKK